MTTTIFFPDSDEMYPNRYVGTDDTDIEFLPLGALDKFVGEYYFFINQGIDTTIDKLFQREYISTMNENVQPSDSVDIKKHIKKVFPERIIKDVQSGKCKYIMDQSLEGYWDINWEFIFDALSITEEKNYYLIFLKKLWRKMKRVENVNAKEQLVWLSGDFKIHEKTNNIAMYINWWEKNCCGLMPDIYDITQTQLKLIESYTEREKYNTLYSRRVRHHRITFMTAMVYHNLLDDMIWSWGGEVLDGPSNVTAKVFLQNKNTKTHLLYDMDKKYSEAYDVVAQWGNIVNEMADTGTDLTLNHCNLVTPSHVLNTYYQCIVETYATDGKTTFLSEKSFKPFMLMQPFVLYGDPLTVQALRDHGYNVYDKWIDHGYDLIMDPIERAESLIKEISRLNSISHSDWSIMLYEMKDILKANHKHLSTANSRYNIKL
jgi:hypothetical protein